MKSSQIFQNEGSRCRGAKEGKGPVSRYVDSGDVDCLSESSLRHQRISRPWSHRKDAGDVLPAVSERDLLSPQFDARVIEPEPQFDEPRILWS